MDYDGKGFTTVQKSPEGDGGFQKSVVYQNFPPHPKIITNESCTPSW